MTIGTMIAFVIEPYQHIFFKKLYEKYWKKDIDGLYIMLSGPNYLESEEWLRDMWMTAGAKIIRYKKDTDSHGECFNALFPYVDEHIIMTIDSDYYVYNREYIRKLAGYIREDGYDIVSSFSNSGSEGLLQKAKDRFKDHKISAPRMNPHLTFVKRDIYGKCSAIDFKAKNWGRGDFIKPLDFITMQEECTDTMGYMGFQLMRETTKIREIPLYTPGESFHPSALSSWVNTLHFTEEDLSGDEDLKTRIAWLYLIYMETCDYFPFKKKNEKHYDSLVRVSNRSLDMSYGELRHRRNTLLAKYPEFKNL